MNDFMGWSVFKMRWGILITPIYGDTSLPLFSTRDEVIWALLDKGAKLQTPFFPNEGEEIVLDYGASPRPVEYDQLSYKLLNWM